MKTEERRLIEDYLVAGWSKRYGRPVSFEEVREINANLVAFVEVMRKIDLYLQEKKKAQKGLLDKNSGCL